MNNNIIKFSEIEYADFVELVKFFSEKETDYFYIRKHLQSFIFYLTGTQAILLDNLIKSVLENDEKSKEQFSVFQANYGDELFFDKEGKQSPYDINYADIGLQSAEICFSQAEENLKKKHFKDDSKFKIDSQIYFAKTLLPLEYEKAEHYKIVKALYYKGNKINISENELKQLENELIELLTSNGAAHLLARFLNYISGNSYNDCHYFIDNFKTRVHALYSDKELKDEINKEFLKTLKRMC